ncbi:GNAT family N-acetyltransferase [Flavobacteriaceae bacterium]|nr:GNAT family N-acetyltransferase [Flavobacteriaceae bacterium]
MIFPIKYRCLIQNDFGKESFRIIPIRYSDRFEIMKWRNDQLYHLRQKKILTKKDQNIYFKNSVLDLFNSKEPDQLLFSFLKNGNLIGYGGLVHINWFDKNAEISFVMDTKLENKFFEANWLIFLELIESLGFNELMFKKLYVYAFDLRPYLYPILEKRNFINEARLHKHVFINKEFKDVVFYSKFNKDEKDSNID